MKRYMAILGFVFVGILAGLLVRGIPIVVQVNAGGEAVATQNGDVNGDSMLDMSDAVYLLIHLFNGGPQPAAFAQMEPADLRGVEDSLESIAYNFGQFMDLQCAQSLDRFVWQEDRTVIDTCKRLMWTDESKRCVPGEWDACNYQTAVSFAENFELAGYSDWRLPTLLELAGLIHQNSDGPLLNLPPFRLGDVYMLWTSTRNQTEAWQVNFHDGSGGFTNIPRRLYSTSFDTTSRPVTSTGRQGFGVLLVRDITPEE